VTDQRNMANRVIAVCSAVIAACAVVLTIEVNTGIAVKQPRVLNPAAVQRQVTDELGGSEDSVKEVECPLYVVVEVGNTFDCTYSDGSGAGNEATVKITSDQGGLDVEDDSN
jgi:hypothetical protein